MVKGANFNCNDNAEINKKKRNDILYRPRRKKPKKLAWVSTWDPRAPDKSKIIHKNMHLLYRNPENRKIFPDGLLIAANRRRPNLGEYIKPTIPRRFVEHGPNPEPGSFPCAGYIRLGLVIYANMLNQQKSLLPRGTAASGG